MPLFKKKSPTTAPSLSLPPLLSFSHTVGIFDWKHPKPSQWSWGWGWRRCCFVRICYVHALGMIVGKLVLIFFLVGKWVCILNKENMGDDDDDRNYYAGLFVLLRALLASFQFST
jgi:hypothetical protein